MLSEIPLSAAGRKQELKEKQELIQQMVIMQRELATLKVGDDTCRGLSRGASRVTAKCRCSLDAWVPVGVVWGVLRLKGCHVSWLSKQNRKERCHSLECPILRNSVGKAGDLGTGPTCVSKSCG